MWTAGELLKPHTVPYYAFSIFFFEVVGWEKDSGQAVVCRRLSQKPGSVSGLQITVCSWVPYLTSQTGLASYPCILGNTEGI